MTFAIAYQPVLVYGVLKYRNGGGLVCHIFCDLRPHMLNAIMPTLMLSFSFGIASIVVTFLISRVPDNFRETQTILSMLLIGILPLLSYHLLCQFLLDDEKHPEYPYVKINILHY